MRARTGDDGLEDRIAGVLLAVLSESDLRAWQLRTVLMPASSRQRIANDFKAVLNATFETYRRMLPADLPTVVKFGLKLDASEMLLAAARDNQILSVDVRAVVAAAIAIDEDLGRLVVLLAATGARFSTFAHRVALLLQGVEVLLLFGNTVRRTLLVVGAGIGGRLFHQVPQIVFDDRDLRIEVGKRRAGIGQVESPIRAFRPGCDRYLSQLAGAGYSIDVRDDERRQSLLIVRELNRAAATASPPSFKPGSMR